MNDWMSLAFDQSASGYQVSGQVWDVWAIFECKNRTIDILEVDSSQKFNC